MIHGLLKPKSDYLFDFVLPAFGRANKTRPVQLYNTTFAFETIKI